jgi:hypothetical protein
MMIICMEAFLRVAIGQTGVMSIMNIHIYVINENNIML